MKNLALGLRTIFVLLYLEGFPDCRVSGNMVSTSGSISLQISRYTDTRLVVPGNPFPPRLIPKGASMFGARVDCTRSCATQENCHAFNVYDNQSSYVCELLSDNLSRNKTVLQLLSHSGSTVWEKRSTGAPTPSSEPTTNPTVALSPQMTTSPTITSTEMTTNLTVTIGPKTSTRMTTKLSTRTTASTTPTTPVPCADVRRGCAVPNMPSWPPGQ